MCNCIENLKKVWYRRLTCWGEESLAPTAFGQNVNMGYSRLSSLAGVVQRSEQRTHKPQMVVRFHPSAHLLKVSRWLPPGYYHFLSQGIMYPCLFIERYTMTFLNTGLRLWRIFWVSLRLTGIWSGRTVIPASCLFR